MIVKILSLIKDRKVRILIIQCCGVAIFFLGFILSNYFFNWGGIPNSINPLYARFDIQRPNIYMLGPIIIFVIFLSVLRSIILDPENWGGISLIIIFIAFSIFFDISIAMIDGGISAIADPFTRPIEYFADIDKVKNVPDFLRNYVLIIPTLGIHGHVHPPGPILFLWAGSNLLGESPLAAAFLVIFFSNIAIIPIYLIARNLYDKQTAIYATSLYLLIPNKIMFTATSMNAVFAFFSAWSVYFFFKTIGGKNQTLYAVLTGLSLSGGILMSFDIFFVGLFFGITTLFLIYSRDISIQHVTIIPIFIVLFFCFLFVLADFNVIKVFLGTFKEFQKDKNEMLTDYGPATISVIYWFFGNPVAFLSYLGIPTLVLYLREILETFREFVKEKIKITDMYIISSLITISLIVCSNIYYGEIERIWLFWVPFVAIPAGKKLLELGDGELNHIPFSVFTILFVHTFIFETVLYTYW